MGQIVIKDLEENGEIVSDNIVFNDRNVKVKTN